MFSKPVDWNFVDRLAGDVERNVIQVVGTTIRRLRVEQGFTQEEFAQFAELDRSFYGRIERGTQNIALKTLCVVAAHLEVHPADLLRDITEADYKPLKPSGR